MPKINLPRTVHIEKTGKVFFKGEAFVTEAEEAQIKAELERLEEIDAQAAAAAESEDEETPKKKKSDK